MNLLTIQKSRIYFKCSDGTPIVFLSDKPAISSCTVRALGLSHLQLHCHVVPFHVCNIGCLPFYSNKIVLLCLEKRTLKTFLACPAHAYTDAYICIYRPAYITSKMFI